jgi:hypothetical protein
MGKVDDPFSGILVELTPTTPVSEVSDMAGTTSSGMTSAKSLDVPL